MKVSIKEVFPTLFYEFQFSEEQILPLYEEITAKKIEIKKRYEDWDTKEIKKNDYWTDYFNPVDLPEYEKLVGEEIPSRFLPDLSCHHIEKWTAIYEEMGYHEAHTHKGTRYEGFTCNMSSILYLSDIGNTIWHNPEQSNHLNPVFAVNSQMGKMIMFPSHILHCAPPHGKKKSQEKIIISSNWFIYDENVEKKDNGE